MSIKKDRQTIYKELFEAYRWQLIAIQMLPRDYATRRSNIYAVKNTNRVYNEQ